MGSGVRPKFNSGLALPAVGTRQLPNWCKTQFSQLWNGDDDKPTS